MNRDERDLCLIETVLRRKEELTDEQIELLEWTRESFAHPLMVEAANAFRRGDDEVGLALAKAFCEKYSPPEPPDAQCVIYCRVSTERQTTQSGLERQLKTCMEYAQAKNYSVVAVFSEVWSGADDLYARAQAERMAKARGCKIVCEDYDRWSRKGIEDMPPKNVEMASEAIREMDAELKRVFTNAQLRIVGGMLM